MVRLAGVGASAAHIAEALSVSRQAVEKWLKGTVTPSIQMRMAIEAVFSIAVRSWEFRCDPPPACFSYLTFTPLLLEEPKLTLTSEQRVMVLAALAEKQIVRALARTTDQLVHLEQLAGDSECPQ